MDHVSPLGALSTAGLTRADPRGAGRQPPAHTPAPIAAPGPSPAARPSFPFTPAAGSTCSGCALKPSSYVPHSARVCHLNTNEGSPLTNKKAQHVNTYIIHATHDYICYIYVTCGHAGLLHIGITPVAAEGRGLPFGQ